MGIELASSLITLKPLIYRSKSDLGSKSGFQIVSNILIIVLVKIKYNFGFEAKYFERQSFLPSL